MKILTYGLILAAVLLFPNHGTDVGKLIPVEVIAISESNGIITVRTDTGDWGEGESLDEAFCTLKETAAGTIYLDTAEYVLVEEGIGKFKDYLKGDTRVYYAAEGIAMEGIADFLSVHKSGVRLKEMGNETEIPQISEDNGRFQISEKSVKKR